MVVDTFFLLSESWTLTRVAYSLTIPCSHFQDCGSHARFGRVPLWSDKEWVTVTAARAFSLKGVSLLKALFLYLLTENKLYHIYWFCNSHLLSAKVFVAWKLSIQHKTTNKEVFKFKNRAQFPVHLVLVLKMPVALGLFLSFWLVKPSALVKLG